MYLLVSLTLSSLNLIGANDLKMQVRRSPFASETRTFADIVARWFGTGVRSYECCGLSDAGEDMPDLVAFGRLRSSILLFVHSRIAIGDRSVSLLASRAHVSRRRICRSRTRWRRL